ncbi:MAG: 3'-5' exonuclease domain-containing protein 2 [Gallionella sp.]|nr:3'-5' exonuclease domain-containing protein 2 [Gallionella sp.]
MSHSTMPSTDNLNLSTTMENTLPNKSDIALMPPFVGLTLERIHVPASEAEFAAATAAIKAAGIAGFDTESKPTFSVGEVSNGPHVVQFALHDQAYLFQSHRAEGLLFLIELLQAKDVLKVGFGLRSDSGHIFRKLGIKFSGVLDLNTVFSMQGHRKEIGVRSAVGLIFNQRFAKSGKISTSNWSQPTLTPQQLLYAANDAYAALKVFEALKLPRNKLPLMGVSESKQSTDKADLSE